MRPLLLSLLIFCSCASSYQRIEGYTQEARQFNRASLDAALQAEGLTLLSYPPSEPDSGVTSGYAEDKDKNKYVLTFSPQAVETKSFRLRSCPPGHGALFPPPPTYPPEGAASQPPPEFKTIKYAQHRVEVKYIHWGRCTPAP